MSKKINLTNQEVYDKFYSGLNPKEYWEFTLQKDLAYEAIDFYITFNNLSIIDIDVISYPYKFTKLSIYQDLYSIISQIYWNPKEFNFSPDSNGGVTAIYCGEKDVILTLDMNKEHTVTLEYITKNLLGKIIYTYEVPTEEKIPAIRKITLELL